MGRQKGEGARSKARPSSSSLAASLLPSSSAAAAVGFGGFVGSSRLDSSLSTEDSIPFLDIDSEVAQHLKRLARKDPTTKLKALASLSALLKQKSAKEIVPIIPQWVFEYKKLLLDYNREVRRATHETMTNLVTAVGRDLAPHLKSLMGPWWFAQFDPSSEVSQAAKRSLQAAFPAPEKRLDALILCTTEIFMYLEENLKLTPQNLSDKAVALDELQEMHQQVISSSLLALTTLLDVLVSVQIERPGFENVSAEPKHASKARVTAISFAEKLFSAHKYFLEFLKSQSPAVRSATYSVLRSFVKNIPQVFDEGNMKTLATAVLGAFQEKDPACHSSMWDVILLFSKRFPNSWTTLNVQKSVFNRFWSFIRNGCFGSQQVSYPALVLFLDAIPPKAFSGDNFFLDFFHNLWAGRNPVHSSNADRLAFFRAFRECFLWGLHNASSVDSISHFRITLINNILVKLLWQDYLSSVSSKDRDSDHPLHGKTTETQNIKYSISYLQDLGKCIVEILSGIYSLERDLLSFFCMTFQETCLGLLQQNVITEQPTLNIEPIFRFLLLVDQHAKQKGEAWPLLHLVGPMLSKSFQLVKSLDSPDGVRLLSISVSVFGAREVLQEIFSSNHAISCGPPHDKDSELELEYFLQVYKETFVPWCLHGHNNGTSARLDLLLALLDDECFSEQWHAVITYAIDLVNSKVGLGSMDSDHLAVLAMLFEKARNEISRRKVGEDSFHRPGSLPDHWHHELLEETAVSIAFSQPPFGTSDVQFVSSVLGGSTEGNLDSFVTRKSVILIFKEVLRKLVSFIMDSSFNSVRQAGALFTSEDNGLGLESKNPTNVVEMARFALEIFEGSFFCLRALDEESGLVSSISAAVFIIDWEYRMLLAVDNAFDDEPMKKIKARLDICQSACVYQSKISNLWKSFSRDVRKGISSILICTIRSAIFKEDKVDTNKVVSLCCLMMIDVLEYLCQDQYEEQNLLDHLLSKGEMWPCWIIPGFNSLKGLAKSDTERVYASAYGNYKFVSLIDKLIHKLGFHKVIACDDLDASSLLTKDTTSTELTSRAWLAAEILCTWKWPEGSAATSFLPLLISFAKSRNYSSYGSFLDSIFNILFDGALVHGENCAQSSLHAWSTSDEDMEDIQEPFLRALVSFLFTLLKENIWGTEKAIILFQLLVDKLFIGEAVNTNCLRILPPIICVLIPTLCRRSFRSSGCTETDGKPDPLDENQMQDTIKSWLQRILLFPPLGTWQTGQDMEEWFHLVFSCYPLTAMRGAEAMKLDRNIGDEERILLLNLFRKQRHENSRSIAANLLPVVQMLLSKLMVISVGYCWREFDDEDWEFLFFHLRCWIESAVVMMEEVAENVNDAVTEHSSSDNLDLIHKKLEKIVLVSDLSLINITKNSLISFSCFCGLLELQPTEDTDSLNHLRTERWDPIKNQILESILRLFFSTGIAEAIAGSYSYEAASIISASRFYHRSFWESVALSVIKSPSHTRDEAVKSVELWGLSKGAICSLYAILFSSRPIPSLQLAAYAVLSTDPVSKLAVFGERSAHCLDVDSNAYQESGQLDLSPEENIHLTEELSYMIEKLPYDVLDMDLAAEQRVHLFLAWSLLLTHLSSLPSLSSPRERLVQYIQNSANMLILDCLFQHLPSDLCLMHVLKKKDGELPNVLSEAATAATRSITTGSLLFSVESLWPIEPVKMAALAGAIYGLMLRLLPAYVRGWFSDLRDRSTSSLIESFTKTWCSPPLVANELSLIKTANFSDENFSVSVSKSANEVVATYTKDETGMDLIIRLPASYPLRPVDVDCMRSLGISEVKQRKWLMSMMLFVRNQNGALAEAIRIWKRNFDKEFEGVEECPICYSVIHTVNHSLPRLACKTCKHKFHAACLYKWFSTSHKSSCPLCQSPF
ncbi:hypothetical protein REPUB_Repub11eG0194700 [Reevesia pubescens]